ncbi:hypothetical protein T492DRAFT_833471 [Pavlovales sp. CCMP2436]|nr:hypothetical protein T492DRAFT_833471 [Pavlovales sp. CCMP2436]
MPRPTRLPYASRLVPHSLACPATVHRRVRARHEFRWEGASHYGLHTALPSDEPGVDGRLACWSLRREERFGWPRHDAPSAAQSTGGTHPPRLGTLAILCSRPAQQYAERQAANRRCTPAPPSCTARAANMCTHGNLPALCAAERRPRPEWLGGASCPARAMRRRAVTPALICWVEPIRHISMFIWHSYRPEICHRTIGNPSRSRSNFRGPGREVTRAFIAQKYENVSQGGRGPRGSQRYGRQPGEIHQLTTERTSKPLEQTNEILLGLINRDQADLPAAPPSGGTGLAIARLS